MKPGTRREIPYDVRQKTPVWNSSPNRTRTSLFPLELLASLKAELQWSTIAVFVAVLDSIPS